MPNIIASIHKEWLQEILHGSKIIEVRKSMPVQKADRIYWHTAGIKTKSIEAFSDILRFERFNLNTADAHNLEKVARLSKVPQEYLYAYAGEKAILCLWHLKPFLGNGGQSIEHKSMPCRAPQSWRYFEGTL